MLMRKKRFGNDITAVPSLKSLSIHPHSHLFDLVTGNVFITFHHLINDTFSAFCFEL